MNKMLSLLLIVLSTSASFAGQLNSRDIRRQSELCMNSGKSVVEIKTCIFKAQDQAEALLDLTYNELLHKTSSDQITLNRLQKSQKSWFMYRIDECSFESSDILGGNGDGLIYSKCILDMTMDRINKLSIN